MKTLEKITNKLNADKEILKAINKDQYYTIDQFINDGQRYIKAIKERRMICSIGSVSSSGMSRTIKFVECSKGKIGYNYLNFFAFFRVLGYTAVNKYGDYFRIGGCGMDMIFHTNYTIIHKLHRLGFINKPICDNLSQMTPTVI